MNNPTRTVTIHERWPVRNAHGKNIQHCISTPWITAISYIKKQYKFYSFVVGIHAGVWRSMVSFDSYVRLWLRVLVFSTPNPGFDYGVWLFSTSTTDPDQAVYIFLLQHPTSTPGSSFFDSVSESKKKLQDRMDVIKDVLNNETTEIYYDVSEFVW